MKLITLICAVFLPLSAWAALSPYLEIRQDYKAGLVGFNFQIYTYEHSPETKLMINIDAQENEEIENIIYKFQRAGISYLAENYLERNELKFTLTIPELKAKEKIDFAIQWSKASPYKYRVDAMLIDKTGIIQKTEYVGYSYIGNKSPQNPPYEFYQLIAKEVLINQ